MRLLKPKIKCIYVFWLAMVFGFGSNAGIFAQLPPEDEYRIKAAFLFNIAKFANWPNQAFENDNSPIVLSIVGKDPFGDFLNFIEGKTIRGRQVVIKRFDTVPEVLECHILFVSRSETNEINNFIGTPKINGVLTIGDTEGFAQNGGMINLIKVDDKIRFEINIDAVRDSGLTISSKLLNLAKIIRYP